MAREAMTRGAPAAVSEGARSVSDDVHTEVSCDVYQLDGSWWRFTSPRRQRPREAAGGRARPD
jgi:hypothetical protein